MRRRTPKSFIALFAILMMLLSLSNGQSDRFRETTVAAFAPFWNILTTSKMVLGSFLSSKNTKKHTASQEDLDRYKLENHLLKCELRRLKEQYASGVEELLVNEFPFISARVIYRSAASWDNSLWINAGKETNLKLGKQIIVKNSPVVIGRSVIGVVDYVGKGQSRVRLITDSALCPSVRVLRQTSKGPFRLAKGELAGQSRLLWRKKEPVLKGIGFNYDNPDEAGPARDLRSGAPLEQNSKQPTMPLVKVDDLLITTGLDGVFPPDLHIAKVTKIYPLQEGDYYYELEAKPTAGNLDDLSIVFVIPPLGFDPSDQPEPYSH